MDKVIGLELNGAVFNQDGTPLTVDQFLDKIESVGLHFRGSLYILYTFKEINEEGNIVTGKEEN